MTKTQNIPLEFELGKNEAILGERIKIYKSNDPTAPELGNKFHQNLWDELYPRNGRASFR